MNEQQATTPQEVAPEAPLSLDDKIAAKYGLDEPEQVEGEPEGTPPTEQVEGEQEVEIPQEEAPPEPVGDFELRHNGEVKKVPVAEAQRLAQMGYDYEFKMQRVNQDAQRVHAMAQAAQARAAIQAQALDAMAEAKSYEKQLQAYANVDWVQETNNDPVGAFQKRMQYDQLVQAWQYADQKVKQLQQPHQQAQQQIDANWAALQEQKLLERVPEWRDGTRRKTDSAAILETVAKDYGFAPEELNGPLMYDHRVVSMLRDAWKYRVAVSGSKARKGQLQGLPQVAKPGAKPAPRSQAQSLGDVKRALRQSTDSGARKALQDELIARKFGLK